MSPGQIMSLPFYQCLIDFYAEVPTGLFDVAEHFVTGF
jgi:hypothetical protein